MWTPYSYKVVNLVDTIDLDDPDLYGAWGMDPAYNTLVDLTAQGNDGTITLSTVEQTVLGPMRRYAPNSGVVESALGAANAFQLGDLTLSFWLRQDIGAGGVYAAGYLLGANDQWAVGANAAGSIFIYDDIDNAGAVRYLTATEQGALHHAVAVMDSLENLLYIDGVLVGSGESASDDWSSYAGILYHGNGRSGVAPFEGIVGPLLVFNTAKDQDWVTQEYNKGAQAISFKTDWGVPVSVGNETTGFVGNNQSPFEILSGSWVMTTERINGKTTKIMECTSDGAIAVPTTLFVGTPTEHAFGRHSWWAYTPSGAILTMWFGATSLGATGNLLVWNADTSLEIQASGVGAVVSGGTASQDDWHKFDVDRRYDGRFEGFVDDVSWGTGTDLTHTTATHLIIAAKNGGKVGYSTPEGDHSIMKYLGVPIIK